MTSPSQKNLGFILRIKTKRNQSITLDAKIIVLKAAGEKNSCKSPNIIPEITNEKGKRNGTLRSGENYLP